MLDGEERAKAAADDGPQAITPEDMSAAERSGLIDEANLTLFVTWWTFGGMEHPPTITEIAAMPAAMRHDLIYLISEFGRLRRLRRKRSGKAATKSTRRHRTP